MTKTDLQGDLLADLKSAANARPLPTSQPALPPPLTVPQGELRPATPALDFRVTPLRWARPGLVAPDTGLGLGLRFGPVEVSLSLGG
ncbi:MAG: hypothetical protein JJD92_06310 [Frankiaceae bacterium]|nr:hypothetical protein [Frankiaceae bacterium]